MLGHGIAGFTTEGGLAIRLVNKTGAPSVKGTIVEADGSTDFAFDITVVADDHAIGVVYESGIPDGGSCLVVVAGIAEVLLEDTTAATRGYWVATSATQAGRADATNAAPPGGGIPELDEHMTELGHALESVVGGTDKLATIMMHFN